MHVLPSDMKVKQIMTKNDESAVQGEGPYQTWITESKKEPPALSEQCIPETYNVIITEYLWFGIF